MQLSRRQACAYLGTLLSLPTLNALTIAGPSRAPVLDGSGLLDAVRTGDLERVRRILETDPDLSRTQDEAGRSVYVLAHLHGHDEVAGLLKATGLELDIVESVLAQDWERASALAEAHPDQLERAHPIGGTPLYAAALTGSLSLWRLRQLGCSPDAAPKGGSGFTPARGAMESTQASWARIALTDLCSNGADINARQPGGDSVLHAAVSRRDLTLVRLAIRKGADVDAVDARGRSARSLALELGWDAGERLLADHAVVPRDDRSSRFALDANRSPIERPELSDVPQALQSKVTGSSHGQLDALRELVQADERLVFSISADDELAIEACAHTGAREIIRYHLDHGAPLSLPTAVALGDHAAIEFWLQRSPSLVNERGAHDFPLMWYAVLGGGSVEIAERLAQHGVPLDQESMGATALHLCVRRHDLDLAHWLLEQGADPHPVGYRWSRDGQTPLQLAVEAGDTKMRGLLEG